MIGNARLAIVSTLSGLSLAIMSVSAAVSCAAEATSAPKLIVTGRLGDEGCALTVKPATLDIDGRERTKRCLAEGEPGVIQDEASGEMYFATFPAAKPAELDRWIKQVGKRVRVTGRLTEREGVRLLEIDRLRVEHDHDAAPHGGVIGMIGERHLELVTIGARELRLYLLDAFLDPIPTGSTAGTAVITDASGRERPASLVAATDGEFLRIEGAATTAHDRDVTVTFTAGVLAAKSMTLPFPEPGHRRGSCPDHQ